MIHFFHFRATSVLDEIGDNTRKNRYSRLLSVSNDDGKIDREMER